MALSTALVRVYPEESIDYATLDFARGPSRLDHMIAAVFVRMLSGSVLSFPSEKLLHLTRSFLLSLYTS